MGLAAILQANNSPSWDLALEMKAMCHLWQPTGFTGGAVWPGQPERGRWIAGCVAPRGEAGTPEPADSGFGPLPGPTISSYHHSHG